VPHAVQALAEPDRRHSAGPAERLLLEFRSSIGRHEGGRIDEEAHVLERDLTSLQRNMRHRQLDGQRGRIAQGATCRAFMYTEGGREFGGA
jgi:hypothetical protein